MAFITTQFSGRVIRMSHFDANKDGSKRVYLTIAHDDGNNAKGESRATFAEVRAFVRAGHEAQEQFYQNLVDSKATVEVSVLVRNEIYTAKDGSTKSGMYLQLANGGITTLSSKAENEARKAKNQAKPEETAEEVAEDVTDPFAD